MLIMNSVYFSRLKSLYDSFAFETLPEPCAGVPISAKEFDYKTYYVQRHKIYYCV